MSPSQPNDLEQSQTPRPLPSSAEDSDELTPEELAWVRSLEDRSSLPPSERVETLVFISDGEHKYEH